MSVINLQSAKVHFSQVDKLMAIELETALLSSSNKLRLPVPAKPAQYYQHLVRIVVGQQISTKAAQSIYSALESRITVTCNNVLATESNILRECGLSLSKIKCIKELAAIWSQLDTASWSSQSDEAIAGRLVSCYGVGSWTANMFLLFAMARSDIFSIHDLGLRKRIAALYSIEIDDWQQINCLADRWSPHRSVAALVLWHGLDNAPSPS